eukprot:3328646-Prymnesium_polylepis.1
MATNGRRCGGEKAWSDGSRSSATPAQRAGRPAPMSFSRRAPAAAASARPGAARPRCSLAGGEAATPARTLAGCAAPLACACGRTWRRAARRRPAPG